MKPAPWALALFALASVAASGCGGSSNPPQDPSTLAASPAPGTANTDDPASAAAATGDPQSASNGSTAPSGAPESTAGPSGHAPIVSTGSSSGDTPIDSGAGDAAPEHAH